jgi:hypothetical protein
MIKCGECGYENLDGLDYCDACGAKLAIIEGSIAEGSTAHSESSLAIGAGTNATKSSLRCLEDSAAAVVTLALLLLIAAALYVWLGALYVWLGSGDYVLGTFSAIALPVSGITVSAIVAFWWRRFPGQTRFWNPRSSVIFFMSFPLSALLFVGGADLLGFGSMLLAPWGHYLKVVFPDYSGGAAGLTQRGATLGLGASVLIGLIFVGTRFAESSRSDFKAWLFSQQTVLIAAFVAAFFGLIQLGDVGGYLIDVAFILLIFQPWEPISSWIKQSASAGPAAQGLTTAQLIILWYGSLVVVALCIVWAAVAESIGPIVLAVIVTTISLAISVRPAPGANKRAVATAVGTLLSAIVILPVGFLIFEHVTLNGWTEPVSVNEVEISELNWFTPAYTGVIGLSAKVKNLSSVELSTVDLKLTIAEPGTFPEILTDTVQLELPAGQEKAFTHFFARPTLGRDVYDFFRLRPAFSNKAGLSYEITAPAGRAGP